MSSNDMKTTNERADDTAKSAVRSARDNVTEMANRATQQAHGVAKQVAQKAGDIYGQAKDQVHAAADHVPDGVADAYAAGHRAYSASSKTLGRRVAKQPIEALLLAGAIGYLVGWATSRS